MNIRRKLDQIEKMVKSQEQEKPSPAALKAIRDWGETLSPADDSKLRQLIHQLSGQHGKGYGKILEKLTPEDRKDWERLTQNFRDWREKQEFYSIWHLSRDYS